ncbi:hypothetical protein EV182_000707 [Spiromyces aspiralis]|uniref:Uncharacterized protein n=1 Tax=Spiromyces aspiralis TaxID=68401 RepID=A0ACC1HVL9_9FUNG|nr:hypothetical protein EV182_000707 [Spiromyces aspiralis]
MYSSIRPSKLFRILLVAASVLSISTICAYAVPIKLDVGPLMEFLSSVIEPETSGTAMAGVNITCSQFTEAIKKTQYARILDVDKDDVDKLCMHFLKGAGRIPDITNREAAMALAQFMWESGGLLYKEEVNCKYGCPQYNSPGNPHSDVKPVPGKSYHGRGYIQLTHPDNYNSCSNSLYGDNRLLETPEQVASDDQTAWDASFWFWINRVRTDPDIIRGKFGASTMQINGMHECNNPAPENLNKAKMRFKLYQQILSVFSPGEKAIEGGCYN